MQISGAERLAAAVLVIEAAGVMVLVAWQFLALGSGDSDSIASSIALIVLTLVGAAMTAAFAWACARGVSWGRSGGIVTQLLILAVALGAVTGRFAHPLTALAVALPALVGLVLLIAAVRAAARRVSGR
ncbi:histidine kinase [Microbacterium sp.]|uniref:histidine kinase n=1 Tax=Microbacterium sp. TaxID=51671 RepID=UPI0039E303F0